MRIPMATYTGDPKAYEKKKKAEEICRKLSKERRGPIISESHAPYGSQTDINFVRICKCCGAELYGSFQFGDYSNPVQDIEWSKKAYLRSTDYAYDTDQGKSRMLGEIDAGIECASEAVKLSERDKHNAYSEYEKAINASKCPVCSGRLSDEKGFFLPDRAYIKKGVYYELDPNIPFKERDKTAYEKRFGVTGRLYCSSYEAKFASIVAVREEADRASAKSAVASYVTGCDKYVAEKVSARTSEIKTNSAELMSYILHLIQLENNIYSLQQHLFELYYQKILNDRAVVMSVHGTAYKLKESLTQKRAAYQEALTALYGAQRYRPDISVNYPSKPAPPVLGVPGLFNKKRVLAENEALTAKYQEAMETYQKEFLRCEEEKKRLFEEARAAAIAKAKRERDLAEEALDKAEGDVDSHIQALETTPAPAKAIKIMLDKEIAEVEGLLKATFAARNELYSYGVIFDKYRDAVSLCTIYEYLMAGRCTSLEGPDGAYNIYENEVRMNRVITQLDTVISSLEEIKQNQYMMYRELQGIKTTLSSLDYTMHQALTSIQKIQTKTSQMTEYMERVAKNSDVIAHNTAVSAYYSKVNAQLTNALGYMIAFN